MLVERQIEGTMNDSLMISVSVEFFTLSKSYIGENIITIPHDHNLTSLTWALMKTSDEQ